MKKFFLESMVQKNYPKKISPIGSHSRVGHPKSAAIPPASTSGYQHLGVLRLLFKAF